MRKFVSIMFTVLVGVLLAAPAFAASVIAAVPGNGWLDFTALGPGEIGLSVVALGLVVDLATLQSIYRTALVTFQEAFGGVESMYEKVAEVVPSSTGQNDYYWLGDFPGMREWIGERHIKSLEAHGYAIVNKEFESTIGVKRKDIADNSLGMFNKRVEGMAKAAAKHPDKLVFALLKNAFTTLCYDGQYFFDTDHPVGDGTVSNHGGGASTAWFLLDTSQAIKPLIYQEREKAVLDAIEDPKSDSVFMRGEYLYGTRSRGNVGFSFWQMAYGSKAPLDASSYAAAYEAMMSLKNDEGDPLGITPTLLVVPPSLRDEGIAILKDEKLANGATNRNRDSAELMVCPWLA